MLGQMDAEVICPQPRRVNRAVPKPRGAFPVYRSSDSAPDLLDLILSMNEADGDTDSSSRVGIFRGSPPVRANNPVIHDPQFGKRRPSFSPVGSSYGKKPAEALGSPSCRSSSPKVRIQGFACRNSEPYRAATFA